MYRFLLIVALLLSVGCDNSITNNSGALPSIDFTGTIWAGNVRNARVQFVGVDQYGQPQRQSDGTYFGDSYYSDDLGQFSASIQGAYTGSLIAVASYTELPSVPATETEPEVPAKQTQIRCVLPSGCGSGVIYGDWYDASSGFEMWGAVSSVSGLEQINITPVTHLAARQAFNQNVDPGSDCALDEFNVDTERCNNIFTPETIFEGNHRAKQFFVLSSGLHVNTTPWYEGLISDDTVDEIELSKHGLMSMALQRFAKDRLETEMETLAWWEASFLKHNGNLYIDGATDAPTDLDATKLFQAVSDIETEYDTESKGTVALASAENAFSTHIGNLKLTATPSDLLPYEPEIYSETLAEKISAADALVTKVRGWALDLGQHQYESFFDADVAQEITRVEGEWAEYNQKLSPVMKSFFKPIIKVAEYALTCIRPNSCDTDHDLEKANNDTTLTFTSGTNTVSLIGDVPGQLELDGKSYNYTSIRLVGAFDDSLGQSELYKKFTFSEALVETVDGTIELSANSDVKPSVAFWLGESLSSNATPIVVRIDVDAPSLKLLSKTSDEYQFISTVFNAILIGTRDPVSLITAPALPYHFNILSVNIDGKFSGSNVQGDSLDFRFTLNSKNATTFYSPTRFPDLEMSIDSAAFKEYTKLAGDASGFIKDQGGWFTLPASVTQADIEDGTRQKLLKAEGKGVVFTDHGVFALWDSSYDLLKELLSLSNSSTAKLGALEYPGGETALIIFKSNSTDETELARQCNRVGEVWGCQAALPVSSLGCGDEFSNSTATVIEAFNWLKLNECIAQVRIDGRGIYDIDYDEDLTISFVSGQDFDITLDTPEYLGIENFYISLISRFVDASNESKPTALMILNGAAPDIENVTMGFSITHDYIGGSSSSAIGIDSLIPYGENSVWLAVGQSSTEQDALVYYIQDSNITMTVFGFNYSDTDSVLNPSQQAPLATIRYDGQLLGSLRKEGSLYVIRYIDGTWQPL